MPVVSKLDKNVGRLGFVVFQWLGKHAAQAKKLRTGQVVIVGAGVVIGYCSKNHETDAIGRRESWWFIVLRWMYFEHVVRKEACLPHPFRCSPLCSMV